MADWMIWLIVAGALVAVEIFSGTFYLLMIGVGLAAGGLAALLGGDKPLQFLIAAVIGILATILLRKKRGPKAARNASSDPNVNIDIGQKISISEWRDPGDGTYVSREMYRGTMWDVDLMPDANPQPDIFIIRAVQGSRLQVANFSVDSNREET